MKTRVSIKIAVTVTKYFLRLMSLVVLSFFGSALLAGMHMLSNIYIFSNSSSIFFKEFFSNGTSCIMVAKRNL